MPSEDRLVDNAYEAVELPPPPEILPDPNAMICLDNVVKTFHGKSVLNGLTLNIPREKITVVIGGSGHGKSTILKHIVGFMHPNSGRVLVDGHDLATLNDRQQLEVQKTIGMSFQYSALFDSMNVFENVAFPLREHTRMGEAEIVERVSVMLTRLGMPGIESKMPSELSGGMKKRVGVARAIMLQPKIMLFDEPETGLDPITTASIGELIMEMRDDFGITCLVISHNMENANRISDQMCMLWRGKIIALGTPTQMKRNKHPVLRQFMSGSPHGPF